MLLVDAGKHKSKGAIFIITGFQKPKIGGCKWVEFWKSSDKFNPGTSYICSRHFKPTAYERNLKYELIGIPEPPSVNKFKPGPLPTLYSAASDGGCIYDVY